MRSSPEVTPNNLIRTNLTGSTLEILSDPECLNEEESSYLWWHVKTEDGLIGWSTEASATGAFYFLEPIK